MILLIFKQVHVAIYNSINSLETIRIHLNIIIVIINRKTQLQNTHLTLREIYRTIARVSLGLAVLAGTSSEHSRCTVECTGLNPRCEHLKILYTMYNRFYYHLLVIVISITIGIDD